MILKQANAKKFAKTDAPCRVCKTILKAGKRKANQFLCCNEDSRDLTDCQKEHYAAKPKKKRIKCDVCGKSIVQQDPNQKRCVCEKEGVDSECQKIAKARTAALHYTPITKELPEPEEANPPGRPSRAKRKKRICMKCRREFSSTGPGHRVCDKCHALNGRVTRKEFRISVPGEVNSHRHRSNFLTEFVQSD